MTAKLHINISQGVLDIEGDPDLVREIYGDFKDRLLNKAAFAYSLSNPAPPATPMDEGVENGGARKPKAKRRVVSRKKMESDEGGSGVLSDSPKLDKNLDTSSLGDFYSRFKPKNASEKILIFLKYITEEVGNEHPNTDQVFTCFKKAGERIPTAFKQAFHDTSSRHGYIDFNSATDIPITIAGDNHFNDMLKAAA